MEKDKNIDKKDKLINVRVNASDYHYFQLMCASVGSNPSDMLRSCMYTCIAPLKVKLKNGEINIEDLEALLDNENE